MNLFVLPYRPQLVANFQILVTVRKREIKRVMRFGNHMVQSILFFLLKLSCWCELSGNGVRPFPHRRKRCRCGD